MPLKSQSNMLPQDYIDAIDNTAELFSTMNVKQNVLFIGDTLEQIYVLICAINAKHYGETYTDGLKFIRNIIKQTKQTTPITHYVIQTIIKINKIIFSNQLHRPKNNHIETENYEKEFLDNYNPNENDEFDNWREIDQFVDAVERSNKQPKPIINPIKLPIQSKPHKELPKQESIEQEYSKPIQRKPPMKLIDNDYTDEDIDDRYIKHNNIPSQHKPSITLQEIEASDSYDEKLAYIMSNTHGKTIDIELLTSILLSGASVREIIKSLE